MRIAIINKTGGGMSGGYKKYLYNVIPRLAVSPNIESILCASPESLNIKGLFDILPNVKFIYCQPFQFLQHKVEPELEKYLIKFSPDVIFIPCERYIKFKKIPTIIMVRNMFPLIYFPRKYSLITKLKFVARRIETKIAVKRSDRIIAVSNFVKDFLIKRWGILDEKISINYHGGDLLSTIKEQKPDSISENLKGKFLFTAGTIQPYRGLEDIFIAMKHLLCKNTKIEGLVIAGNASPNMINYQNKLKKWIEIQNFSSKVFWVGNLNNKEMKWCYKNCCIFVMTSRVESFGNIALEAMIHGCICIAADNPCLPEIFEDAAIYYPPKNGTLLAEIIQYVLKWDNYQRKKISEKAKNQAAKFSWDKTVERLLVDFKKAKENIK